MGNIDGQTIGQMKRYLRELQVKKQLIAVDDMRQWELIRKKRKKILKKCLNVSRKNTSPKLELKWAENPEGVNEFFINDEDVCLTGGFAEPPAAKNKAPVIVLLHGKGNNGRDAVLNWRDFLLPAGFGVIGLDLRCHGRRAEDADQAAQVSQLLGFPMAGLIVSDVLRLIDAIPLFPKFDRQKIAIAGFSMGGRYAFQSAVLDDRIQGCAALISVTTMREMIFQSQLLKGLHNYSPGLLACLDFDDMLPMLAPRRFMALNGSADLAVPARGTEQCMERMRKIYRLYNAEDNLMQRDYPVAHTVTGPMKEDVACWFAQWLQ